MNKKDAYLPGIRVPSELAEEFKKVKLQAYDNLSEIGRELVQDFIRIAQTGERISRPARFVTEGIARELKCELLSKTDDGFLTLRCKAL